MDQFSISQLAQFSGIKAHTIRIWEQRYDALQPHRSEGNTRYYDGLQLRRLLNIVSLSRSNFKVSQLCTMTDEELFKLQEDYYQEAIHDKDYEFFISQLVSAGMNYEELSFDKFFSHCLLRFGLKKTYIEVLYPVLNRVGLMWSRDQIPPAQEHFISNLLRQKLFTAVDGLIPETDSEDVWMLFLPENEFHEIGLLFASYFIRSAGKKVIYLGPNVPLASVESAVKDTKASRLLTFFVHRDFPENIDSYLNELKRRTNFCEIYVAASEEMAGDSAQPVKWLHTVEDFEEVIQEFKKEWRK